MSLVTFIRLPDVAERLRPFRHPVRPHPLPLRVPARFSDPALTGTAFDYLLRFELKRRVPHARDDAWVAEIVPQIIHGPSDTPGVWVSRDFLAGRDDVPYVPPPLLAEAVESVCRAARTAVSAYVRESHPTAAAVRTVAGWAVRLAKLDGVYRRGEFDPSFEEAPAVLVEELVALLGVVPFEKFAHPESLTLNPDFADASSLVGGADADLIVGDTLVDIKTTRSAEVRGETLDQLFGYFLLARRAGLPPIRRVGVYLSRYGRLRTGSTEFWTSRPEFAETEEWFFARAGEVYGDRWG